MPKNKVSEYSSTASNNTDIGGINIAEAPEEVWLVECQRCFLQRIIYPSDRVTSKEDDIVRCDQCGGWKMKSAKCRICRLAAGLEKISVKYWTGNTTMERPYDEQTPFY